jgi:signal transduction histidine kinase/CheY-like chemotaxis protein
MSFFVEIHDCYELLVSHDRSGGACLAGYDIMARSREGDGTVPSPHVTISNGYLFMTIRNQCGNCSFLTLVVVNAETQFVPGLEDFYARFTIMALSLCYLIINQESDEVSFRNCVSMIAYSHQFSVLEFTVDRDEPISKMGAVAKDPAEYEFINTQFLDCLTVTQRLDFLRLLRGLKMEGIGFSQETYRILMPDGRMRWVAVTADSHYDEHLGSTIFSYLYEDISHLQQLESQVQETVKSMALASRLLGLHEYSLSDDGLFNIEKMDLLSELGYGLDRFLDDLLDLVQREDVAPLKSLPEGSTLTIRLREGTTGNWHWYTAICTNRQGNVSHGVLFSVHALTQLQSKMQITRDCLKFGSDTNAFAFWEISLKSDQGGRSVFETKTVRFLQQLLDPAFVHLVQIEELMKLQSPKTIEVRMKLPEWPTYEWFSITFILASSQQLLCFAFNIDKRKQTETLLDQTQQLLELAFTYSDVRMWSFEDAYSQDTSALTFDAEFADRIDMDWSTLEHNVTVEYQAMVTSAFRTALDEGQKLELEVPFFFENVHWLLLRGFCVDDEGERRLIGIYMDLTDIKEAYTELARQKAAAEEASMAKSTFLANMTHEIRAPLNGICGLLDILIGPELTPEQLELANTIQSSFSELHELLNDTLDLAKIESKKLLPLCVQFDPLDTVSGLQEAIFIRRRIPDVEYHILTEPGDPILWRGDPYCFSRILTNLLSNCAKFTRKGCIVVEVHVKDDSGLILKVRDTGVGMANSRLQTVRDHFLNAEAMAVYENTAVGVGLSLVTEMVRLCCGSIAITSEINVGTEITVTFPWEPTCFPYFPPRCHRQVKTLYYNRTPITLELTRKFGLFYGFDIVMVDDINQSLKMGGFEVFLVECADDGSTMKWLSDRVSEGHFGGLVLACLTDQRPPPFPRQLELFSKPLKPQLMRAYFAKLSLGRSIKQFAFHRTAAPVPTMMGLHVLAVDDNSTNQLVIRQMLKKLGCTFRIAENGEEAVAAVQSERFDLVLMDQFMPVLDGPGATRKIRQLEGPVSQIPIIAMTASNLQEDEAACKKAGMNSFVVKPVTLRALAKVMDQTLHRPGELVAPENYL